MNSHLIESHYDIKVSDMRLLEEHFGTEIYLVDAGTEKYIVKAMPLYFKMSKMRVLLPNTFIAALIKWHGLSRAGKIAMS